MNKKQNSNSGDLFANLIAWWLVIMVFGSITGIWVKFFWIGWVLR